MKVFDVFLSSMAVGLTALTLFLLGRGAVPMEAPAPPPGPFKSIVIHGNVHGGATLELHFIVDPEGVVREGHRWRDRLPGSHTGNDNVNRVSVAVGLGGAGAPSPRQLRALVALLERLCRELSIPPERVVAHFEAEPAVACPGRGLKFGEIRARLQYRPVP